MRTTLKRGIGRGAAVSGNGRPVLPPGALSPITIYRQPEPAPRSGWATLRKIFAWSLVALLVVVGSIAGGAYLWFHESVAEVVATTPDVKIAAKRLDVALPGQPATALVVGYDQRAGEGAGTKSRSDTVMLVRADPETKSISLLSFPRDLYVEVVCPGRATFSCAHQRRLLGVRHEGHARDGPQADRAADQLPDHGQLPRLPPARRRGRRHLDRRRPALLQRPRRRLRLRDDQPLPGLPEARRLPGARLRPLPAHRLRPLPPRPSAALRAGVQGPGQVEHERRSTCRSWSRRSRRTSRSRQGGTKELDLKTVIRYALFAYGLPPGHFFQPKLEGIEENGPASTCSCSRREHQEGGAGVQPTQTSSRPRRRPRSR